MCGTGKHSGPLYCLGPDSSSLGIQGRRGRFRRWKATVLRESRNGWRRGSEHEQRRQCDEGEEQEGRGE